MLVATVVVSLPLSRTMAGTSLGWTPKAIPWVLARANRQEPLRLTWNGRLESTHAPEGSYVPNAMKGARYKEHQRIKHGLHAVNKSTIKGVLMP